MLVLFLLYVSLVVQGEHNTRIDIKPFPPLSTEEKEWQQLILYLMEEYMKPVPLDEAGTMGYPYSFGPDSAGNPWLIAIEEMANLQKRTLADIHSFRNMTVPEPMRNDKPDATYFEANESLSRANDDVNVVRKIEIRSAFVTMLIDGTKHAEPFRRCGMVNGPSKPHKRCVTTKHASSPGDFRTSDPTTIASFGPGGRVLPKSEEIVPGSEVCTATEDELVDTLPSPTLKSMLFSSKADSFLFDQVLSYIETQVSNWMNYDNENFEEMNNREDDHPQGNICTLFSQFLDILWNAVAAFPDDLALAYATMALHQVLSAILGKAKCCFNSFKADFSRFMHYVQGSQTDEFEKTGQRPRWRQFKEWNSLIRCTEWAFWSHEFGRVKYGLRGMLWDYVLEEMDYRIYGVTEPLTVAYALSPLCLHSTLAKTYAGRFSKAEFKQPYENCFPTHMSYAIDHLLLAGEKDRAMEAYELSVGHPLVGSPRNMFTSSWRDFHYTPIGGLPVFSWPWWHKHPQVASIIKWLEQDLYPVVELEHSTLLAEDREKWSQLNLYPATSRGGRWGGASYFHPCDPDGLAITVCQMTPRTCRMLIERLGWSKLRDTLDRKWDWSIIKAEDRMGGHSGQASRINIQLCVVGCEGSELLLNGQVTPFLKGRALAWQDGWRHEVLNRGSHDRFVLMITIVHPDLQYAEGVPPSLTGADELYEPFIEKGSKDVAASYADYYSYPGHGASAYSSSLQYAYPPPLSKRKLLATTAAPKFPPFDTSLGDIRGDPVYKWFCEKMDREASMETESPFKMPLRWDQVVQNLMSQARDPTMLMEEHGLVATGRSAYD